MPLFVPAEANRTLEVLDEFGPDAFVTELKRLAGLGSAWARATLGYIWLHQWQGGTREYKQTLTICADPSTASDAYVQFVMAWALYFDKQYARAAAAIVASAKQRFPPALIDSTVFAMNGVGFEHPSREVEFRMLRIVIKSRHGLGWGLFCERCRSGRLGWQWRFVGYFLAPYAWARYVTALLANPFSVCVVNLDTHHRFRVLANFEMTA